MCKQNSLNSKILTSYKVPSNIEFINELLKKEVANNKHKIIVLDDDPTGVQTVHDISVYTLLFFGKKFVKFVTVPVLTLLL